jgi:hypothetical protein
VTMDAVPSTPIINMKARDFIEILAIARILA